MASSQRIQLPIQTKRTRKPCKESKAELYERLRQNQAVCKIFRAYKTKTPQGYADALLIFLWSFVCPPHQFSPKTAKRAVDGLAAAIVVFRTVMATYLKDFPPDVLEAQVTPFLVHLTNVEKHLDLWHSVIHEDRGPKRSGRPPGVSYQNFAAAVLAKEFRRRFRQPRWNDIATLIDVVDPSRFAKINEESNLPGEAVRSCASRVLTKHKNEVKKLWKGMFGSTAGWPPPRFNDW